MISFAFSELGCSYLEVYDMSWAEFLIRSIGFRRLREFDMMMTREVAYASYVGGWMGKGKPPSKEKFWPIGTGAKKGITDHQKEAMKKAWAEYQKQKNG